ncbi:hypothetical protein LTR17_018559 [Elasticomyces elasticus]|nr:hypothetical protein LTR17_018559 [Elasticomyces elasticus]
MSAQALAAAVATDSPKNRPFPWCRLAEELQQEILNLTAQDIANDAPRYMRHNLDTFDADQAVAVVRDAEEYYKINFMGMQDHIEGPAAVAILGIIKFGTTTSLSLGPTTRSPLLQAIERLGPALQNKMHNIRITFQDASSTTRATLRCWLELAHLHLDNRSGRQDGAYRGRFKGMNGARKLLAVTKAFFRCVETQRRMNSQGRDNLVGFAGLFLDALLGDLCNEHWRDFRDNDCEGGRCWEGVAMSDLRTSLGWEQEETGEKTNNSPEWRLRVERGLADTSLKVSQYWRWVAPIIEDLRLEGKCDSSE